ncbi:MAG: hypothetical protein WCF65_09345 [Parachlamydiaceae bacterium]
MVSRIDSIQPKTMSYLAPDMEKGRNFAAEAQVAASSYYASSIQSLAPVATQEINKSALKVKGKSASPSFFTQAKNRFLSLFGVKTEKSVITETPHEQKKSSASTGPSPIDSIIPRLAPPELIERKQMTSAAAELNRRFNGSVELEKEMNESNDASIDKLIFLQLIHSALRQKELKEEDGFVRHTELLKYHHNNKKLHETYYNHLDYTRDAAKKQNILKWVNVVATGAIAATFAISFFLSGGLAALGAATPIASALKGTTLGINGVLKHNMEKEKGEMGIVQLDIRRNSGKTDDGLGDLEKVDQEIAHLYKLIKEALKHHDQAARACIGRT